MVIDWLAAGVDPSQATLFIQSRVPQHAELHLLLSMITPLGWLERVPTYKDQQEKLTDKDLSTYGFLGYPLLQSADILIYRANRVPVGEDQVPHIEFTREIARRFNHVYGREPGFEQKAEAAVKKLGAKRAKLYRELRTKFLEQGDAQALEAARALLEKAQNLALGDRERLFGYLEGGGKVILTEPQALLTEASKMPGLDGQKMSKSYNNTISLREDPDSITQENPHHADRPGAREAHRSRAIPKNARYGSCTWCIPTTSASEWVQQGCRSAGIGCLECKQPVIDGVLAELKPMRERAQRYLDDPTLVKSIIADGCEKAQKLAEETMRDVREVMGLSRS